jgi:hypothetical protein
MTNPYPEHAVLDGILRRAKHLILDFDGPVCSLYSPQAAQQAADRLRAILAKAKQHFHFPEAIATTAD